MRKHVVAIIGRPNIGKSTIFNRITRTKKAIVSDKSGVTRDRIYQDVFWNEKEFILIDTGGMMPDSEDFFESRIKFQAEIAIEEADSIIFLLDASTGITSIDESIATILKKTQKDVFVVVNKVDDQNKELDVAEFYNLGLGEPIGVSALNGRNIGNMLDNISKDIGIYDKELAEADTRLKIALVGKPNVGKSSFINTLLDKDQMIVSDIPGTTRDSVDSVLKYQKEEIIIVDTAGLRRKTKIDEDIEFYSAIRTLRAIEKCDVAILMIDVQSGITSQDVNILKEIEKQKKGIIIAVNKWDLITNKETKTAKEYEENLKSKLEWISYMPIKFVSVLEKQRLFKLLDLAKTIKSEREKRIPTSKLNDYLIPIIHKTPPAAVRNKFIKINYITQAGVKPPVFTFFTNEPKLIKDNYKKFLERKLREKMKFTGVPIVMKFVSKYKNESE